MVSSSRFSKPRKIGSALLILSFCFVAYPAAYAQTQSDTTRANQYFAKAEKFTKAAQYDTALFYYEKTASIYQALGLEQDSPYIWEKFVQCYNGLGVVLRRQGKYDRALECLEKALEIGLKKLGPPNLAVAASYHGIGVVHSNTGDYNKALEYFQKSLQTKLPILGEKHSSVASSYNSIGNVYRAKGDYDKALEFYQKCLQIALQTVGDQHPTASAAYNNIGIIFYDKGDYDRALEYFHKSLSIDLQTLGEKHPSIGSSYNNIGNIYHDKVDYDKALEYHRKALDLRLQTLGGEHGDVAESYFNLGRAFYERGEYEQALEYHQKALSVELQAFGEKHFSVAESYIHLGKIHDVKGEYDEALAFCRKALALQLQILGKRHPDIALTYQQFGKIYEKQGFADRALEQYQKSIAVLVPAFRSEEVQANPELNQISNKIYLLSALNLKAAALKKLSQNHRKVREKAEFLKSSLSTHALASQLADNMRTSYRAEGSKLFLAKGLAGVYDNAIQVALQLYDLTQEQQYRQQAFLFMEKSKAVVLHEALQESQAKQFAAIPTSLLEKERELRIDLAHYETEVQKELSEEEQDQRRLQDWRDRFFAATQEYERLISRFEKEFPQYYNLKYQTRTASIDELQKGLDSRTALIEYVAGDSMLYIAAITRNAFELFALPLDAAFEKIVGMFCTSLKTVDKEDYLQSGADLYNFLIRPIAQAIAGKERLLIIPDGILHYVPFEALLISSSGSVDFGKLDYLIRRYEISYNYSATLFLDQLRAPVAKQIAAGFAGFAPVFADAESGWLARFSPAAFIKALFNYRSVTVDGKHFKELKYSQEEVQTIAEMFERRNATGLGYFHDKASEENFKANAHRHKYIHIATHGLLNEEKPELSGLLFSPPKDSTAKEDGVLYSAECYNLELNADLVVLGSCESGVGKLVKGEGLMALTRGFLYSGARSVIHSLWKVDDKHTSRLIIELYRNILAGKSHAAALRAAKLNLMGNELTAFPMSWSSFVLVGK